MSISFLQIFSKPQSFALGVIARSLLLFVYILWVSVCRHCPSFLPGHWPARDALVTSTVHLLHHHGLSCPSHPWSCGGCNIQALRRSTVASSTGRMCAFWTARVTLHPRGHLPAWLSVNTVAFIIDSLGCDSPTPKAAISMSSGFCFFPPFSLRTPEYLILILLVGLRLCISNKLLRGDSAPGLWTKDSKTADQRPQLKSPRKL